jgi:hypothetical protein
VHRLSACGGDDDEDEGTEQEALTKEEYIAQGNRICERFLGQTDQIAADTFPQQGEPSPAQLSEFAGKVGPVISEGIAELRELPPPEGDEEQVAAIYDAADDAVAQYEQAAENPQEAQEIFEGDPPREAQRLSDEYGLTACGENR